MSEMEKPWKTVAREEAIIKKTEKGVEGPAGRVFSTGNGYKSGQGSESQTARSF